MKVPTSIAPMLPTMALRRLIPLTVLAGCSLAGAGLSYVLWLSPAEQRLMTAEAAYQMAKQTQTTLQNARMQQTRARAAQRRLDLVQQALPTQEEFTALAMALSELGRSEQVAIPGMGYDIKKSDGGQPAKATIAFHASGDYAAVYRFIHRLETVDPYVVIESLDVTQEHASKAEASGRVVVNIRVATHLRQGMPSGKVS